MVSFLSLDSLINGSANWLASSVLHFLFIDVLPMSFRILLAPFTNPSMMWIVTPLLISMTLMQLYFARHRQEELGWSSAFGNSISLIFVSINLLQFLFNSYGFSGINPFNPASNKLYLIIGLGLISVVQLFINFFHLIPKRIAFFINSAVPTNMTAYIMITLVYTDIPLNFVSLTASFILLVLMIYLFNFIKGFIPMSEEALEYTKRLEEIERRKQAWIKKLELRQERAADALLADSLIIIGVVVSSFFVLLVVKLFIDLPAWVSLLVEGVVLLVSSLFILFKRGLSIHNLNFDGETGEALLGVLFGVLLFFSYSWIILGSWFFIPNDDALKLLIPMFLHTNNPFWINVLLFGLLLPFSVEIGLRGVVMRSLKPFIHSYSHSVQAILYSLIVFAFAGIDGYTTPYSLLTIPFLFLVGLVLGFLRDKWGLECALTTHLSFNTIGLLLLFFTL